MEIKNRIIATEIAALGKGIRYGIVDTKTGRILENANGYGFTTPQKAWKVYCFKRKHKEISEEASQKRKAVAKFIRENRELVEELRERIRLSCENCSAMTDREIGEFISGKGVELPFPVRHLKKQL